MTLCIMYRRGSGETALYIWSRSNGALPEGSVLSDYNRKLTIYQIRQEDEGEYTCSVSYRLSLSTNSVSLTVKGVS